MSFLLAANHICRVPPIYGQKTFHYSSRAPTDSAENLMEPYSSKLCGHWVSLACGTSSYNLLQLLKKKNRF